jgi:hypothetical protein
MYVCVYMNTYIYTYLHTQYSMFRIRSTKASRSLASTVDSKADDLHAYLMCSMYVGVDPCSDDRGWSCTMEGNNFQVGASSAAGRLGAGFPAQSDRHLALSLRRAVVQQYCRSGNALCAGRV